MVKLPEATQKLAMVDHVRKMTVNKSCKYGEYGLFDHLLLLFFFCSTDEGTEPYTMIQWIWRETVCLCLCVSVYLCL